MAGRIYSALTKRSFEELLVCVFLVARAVGTGWWESMKSRKEGGSCNIRLRAGTQIQRSATCKRHTLPLNTGAVVSENNVRVENVMGSGRRGSEENCREG
jgi:hypothetical protein